MSPILTRFRLLSFALAALLPALVACGGDDAGDDAPTLAPGEASASTTLRLAYFPNITHAPALIGVSEGLIARELGSHRLQAKAFNAGPAVIEAMFAGEIDAAYIGPNPAINAFQRSNGEAIRIVSGASSGGALLVVRPGANINGVADLANKKIATPQLGGTQDVALRAYLQANGLAPKEKGGTVTVLPTENANTLTLFQQGQIDGAWVPEPWASRLVLEAGGRVFLDERSLWPNGEFVTTHIIVTTKFLREHPDAVEGLLRANLAALDLIKSDPAGAKVIANRQIEALTGKPLGQATIDSAWQNLTFTHDPIASSLAKAAQNAYDAGLLGRKKPDLDGIYALDILNRVLGERQIPAVRAE